MQKQHDFISDVNTTVDRAHQSIKKIRKIGKQLDAFTAQYKDDERVSDLVEKAKKISPKETMKGPTPGRLALKAVVVRAAPDNWPVMAMRPLPSKETRPETRITRAVMVQITRVSMKGLREAMMACLTGLSVLEAAWAMGALPRPDSLEKTPRATP